MASTTMFRPEQKKSGKMAKKGPGARAQEDQKIYGVYIKSVLTKKVSLLITEIGGNIKQNLEKKISKNAEGRCIAEGFIQPGSIQVISYSAGLVNNENIEFQTIFECMICHPVEGMLIKCLTKTITKAGIHAEVIDQHGFVPITVFVARDHHFTDRHFAQLTEGQDIKVRVIGVRFELNDPYICVIGQLLRNE